MRASVFACVAVIALPSGALAQGWSASRYTAPFSGDDLNAVERPRVTPHLRVGGLVAVDWAHSLAAVSVENRVTAHAVVNVGFFDRLQIAAAMPVVVTQHQSTVGGASLAPGDLSVDARVRVAGLARRGFGRVALAVTALLPTGDPAALTGDGSVGVVPRVLVEVNNARDYVFAASVGVALRPGWENQIQGRAAVTIPVVPRVLLAVEALFETNLTDPGARGAISFEALGGVHHVSRRGVALGLAAGPRLVAGAGSADVRVVGLIGYAPQPPEEVEAPGDRDGDGVVDPEDRCPDEPAGPRPDPRNRGCPVPDRDHDGFRDEVDVCPTQPPGDDPDPERVGCPRHDRDRDGVRDGDDLCPDDPAGPHPDPSRRGCPDPDPDGDGVLAPRDACPEERGVATNDPATTGCPRVYVTADRVVITQQPRFANNRDVILAESVPLLVEVASVIEAHPELTLIEVQGHTDAVGPDTRNDSLSRRRAESIVRWLVGHGIAAGRLNARGYGENVPVADNATEAGRARNRRVEFVVRSRSDAR